MAEEIATCGEDFVEGDGLGQMDMPRIREGHLAGGFFAIFSPPITVMTMTMMT